MPDKSVYMESIDTALKNGDGNVFRDSKIQNTACRDDIDNAIKKCYVLEDSGYRLNEKSVSDVIDKHGAERVGIILANTVMLSDWDGRLSQDTKNWAKSVVLPHESCLRFCECTAHKAVLEGYIRLARKELERKPSIMESLKSTDNSRQQSEHTPTAKKSKGIEL